MRGERLTKSEFVQRLEQAAALARDFAAPWVIEELPDCLVISLRPYDDPRGARGPAGTLKFFGGRFLRADQLCRLEPPRAAELLWVDGRVPAWVNLAVSSCSDGVTEIAAMFCKTLVEADPSRLGRDIGASPKNELAPFRIRGPTGPYNRQQDGKPIPFSLGRARE